MTPVGGTADLFFAGLVAGRCAVAPVPASRTVHAAGASTATQYACMVPDADREAIAASPRIDPRTMPDFVQFAVAASDEALRDAGLLEPSAGMPAEGSAGGSMSPLRQIAPSRAGCLIGSGIGSLEDIERSHSLLSAGHYRKVSPFFIPRMLVNMASGHVTRVFGLQGPSSAVATACAAGAHAIGDAYNLIRLGYADAIVAGGAEACITPLSLAGFARGRALSSCGIPRPFDRCRDGFVIGEGAGIVVLESLEHALRRPAPRIYAEVVGYGLGSDAYHMTSPSPDGRGSCAAMLQALSMADADSPRAADVGVVFAHATSTVAGDAVEAHSIASVLRQCRPTCRHILTTSIKGHVGHMLGAAGAANVVAAVKAMEHRLVPRTVHFQATEDCLAWPSTVDKDATVSSAATVGQHVAVDVAGKLLPTLEIPRETVQMSPLQQQGLVLSNAFGFGGTNVSLVLQPYPKS